MKKILLAFLLITTSLGFAQKKATLISSSASINKFHTLNELHHINKGELTTLYEERLKVLLELLPYIGLANQPNTSFKELGIPESNDNLNQLKEQEKSRDKFRESVDKSLNIFIAYADTENLKWAILFYEEIIKKANLGNNF